MSETAKKIVDNAVPVVQKAAEMAPDLLDSGMDVAVEVIDTASKNKRGLIMAGAAAIVLATVGTGAYLIMKRRAAKNNDDVTETEAKETEKVVAEKKPVNEKF